MSINPCDIIRKKRFGQELSELEIRAFVDGIVDGSFADYQASALLMAICINGMTDRETLALTLAGLLREVLGNGTAFGAQVMPAGMEPMAIFVQPPGAFLILALIIAVMNAIGIKTRQRKLVDGGCDGACAGCTAECPTNKEVDAK